MLMARKKQARRMPHTAKMEMTTKRVRETRDGRMRRNVLSTGGELPPAVREGGERREAHYGDCKVKHDECPATVGMECSV